MKARCTDPACPIADIENHAHLTAIESDELANQVVQAIIHDLPEPAADASFDLPGGESTAAALRRAEQERDKAIRERDSLARRCALRFEETEKLRDERDMALIGCDNLRDEVGRAEQERDRLSAAVDDLQADLANAQQECDEAHATGLVYAEKLLAERDLARAELASARQEIEHLRAQVASKGSYIDELIAERDRLIAHLRDVMT
jgi:chromosome segregation ATPase